MAKTIDREKNAVTRARASEAVRPAQDVEEAELMDNADAEGSFGEAGDASDEESLAVAPVSGERAIERRETTGVEVPAWMLASPLTRGLAESYLELRKVTWPTRQEAWNMTLVVIAVSIIMSGLLALADFGLGHLLSYLVSLGLGH